ncbi:MAG: hypothetical protein K2V38_07195 [Gemmataceae bacterium]|nr:hypothetical protein [Gemmataceae bacterium]
MRTLVLVALLAALTGCGDTKPTTPTPAEQKGTPPPKDPKTGLSGANPQ